MFDTRPLFLPDILPCPGPDLCEFHSSIFNSAKISKENPGEWYCKGCKRSHQTVLTTASSSSNPLKSLSIIESLPNELVQHIATLLPCHSQGALALTSKTICRKIGNGSW